LLQGECGNGRIMCCRSATRIRDAISTNDGNGNVGSGTKSLEQKRRETRIVRSGLLRRILSGSSSIVDDTLDLFLQPYLNEEDQQRLATRFSPA